MTTVLATYTYDALDRRIGEKAGSTTTWTLYDGSDPHPRLQRLGDADRAYLDGPTPAGVDAVLAREISGVTAWYLGDRLGTIRDLINNSGATIDRVEYNVYGGTVAESAPSAGDRYVSFAGLVRDSATELNLAINRVQDPNTGRWLSPDPWGFKAGDPNLDRYLGNDPENFIDPSGYMGSAVSKPRRPIPTAPELVKDPTVIRGMNWLMRKSLNPNGNIQEEGLWIFWDPKGDDDRKGGVVLCYTHPEKWDLDAKGREHYKFGRKPYHPRWILIGMIHTHPEPTKDGYLPDPKDSPRDVDNQPNYHVPWIIPVVDQGSSSCYILENKKSKKADWDYRPDPDFPNYPFPPGMIDDK